MKVGRQALNDAAGEQFFDVAQLAEEAAAVDVRLGGKRVRPWEVLKGVKVAEKEKKKKYPLAWKVTRLRWRMDFSKAMEMRG